MNREIHPLDKSRTRALLTGLLVVVMFCLAGMARGQTAGDYQSASSGNWTTLATWQRYNGTTWITPSAAEGYPGQLSGVTYGVITIQTGHTVTIGTGGITTFAFGKLTIQPTGQLYLTGSNATVTFSLNTSVIDIQAGGSIFFYKKSKLVLTTDAVVTLVIGQNGLVADVCNNNAEFWIGSQKYAVCAGAPGAIFTFDQFISSGGTLNSIPSSNTPLCQGGTIGLTGSYGGAIGTAPTYSWVITAPGGAVTTPTTKDVSIPSALTGTYSAKLTVTTVYGGTTYTNSETIYVTVNPLPTLSVASQPITVCDGSPAIINLTGLVPGNTFDLYYTIAGGSTITVTGLTSSSSGTSSFATTALSASNNQQTLQITGIKITNPTTNCTKTFALNVILSVWTTGPGTWTGMTSNDWNTPSNWCGNSVPGSGTDVYIPPLSASVPNQPLISITSAVCRNITIYPSASLTISGSNALSVYGSWTNNGTFTANSSTVSFKGSTTAQIIGGSGANTFYNLTINNTFSGGGVKAGGNITVNGVLNLASVNPSSSVGALEMVTNYNGYPGTTTTVPIVSYILTMGANATTIGQGDVTGKIQRNAISANTAYSFGNQFTTYAFTVAPAGVTVIVTIGTAYGQAGVWGDPLSVKRSYEMIPAGSSGGRVAMNLHYLDTELNGNTETRLTTGDYDIGPGGAPLGDEHGRSSYNITDNYIGLSGVPIEYFIYDPVVHDWRTVFTLHDFRTGHFIWTGNVSTVWYDEDNWIDVATGGVHGIPGEASLVTIPDVTNDPIVPDNLTLGGVQILAGGNLNLNSKTITLNSDNYNGWEDQSGLSNYTGSTVVFTSTTVSTPVLGIPHFDNLTVNTGASITVEPNSHIYISGTFTNLGTVYANTFDNTVEYNGTTTQTVVAPFDNTYYSLALSGSGTKTLPATLVVSHDFTMGGSANVSGTALSVGGNFTNNSSGSFSTGTVVLNGTTVQTIGGSMSTPFNSLTLNNAAGATLGISETVNGTLTLTNGLLTTTGSYLLTINCAGSISGASASSYINGPLALIYCTTGSKDFPIGKGGNYRPLTLEYTALTGTSTVTAEQFESTIPGTSFPANTTYQTVRHWKVTQAGGSGFTYTITLDGTPFIPGSGTAKILKGDGTTNIALAATFSNPKFTTTTGQTSFSYFAVASECTSPVITADPSPVSVCEGTGTAQFTVTASGGGLSWQWEENSGTGWANVASGAPYSGQTSSTLTIIQPPAGMNSRSYRVVVSRDCGSSVTSNAAILTVNALPGITPGDSPSVCSGTTSASLAYTSTTGSPDQYRIDYDATAEGADFLDVAYRSLPVSPIGLTVPAGAAPGSYFGSLYVKNSITTCESAAYPFTVTIIPLPQGSVSGNTICSGGTGQLTWTATAGTGPFTIVYNDGAADRTATGVSPGIPFSVYTNPTVTTPYTLVSVTGVWCTRTTGFEGGTATITVEGPVAPTGVTVDRNTVCQDDAGDITLTATGGSGTTLEWYSSSCGGTWVGTGTPLTVASPAATTTYYARWESEGCDPSPCESVTVTAVDVSPSVTAGAYPTDICSGSGTITLTASASPATLPSVLLSENFNAPTNNWTKINNSVNISGSTPANAAWTLRPDGFQYNGNTWHSNDNSQFYLSSSEMQGGWGVTATILQSPIMSTVGYSTLSLDFYHNYSSTISTANVEVSTDGSNWTSVASFTSTQGAVNAFTNQILNLDTYIGNAVFYIRFNYLVVPIPSGWWAIDNVTLTGTKAADWYYSWEGSPSATAGLPTGAETPSAGNASIMASPSTTTSYTVTAINPTTGCWDISEPVAVTLSNPTITGTTPGSRCGEGTVTLGATASAGTINWYNTETDGESLGTGTSFTTPTISETTTYYVDATENSCTSATRTAVTATVIAQPDITNPGSQEACDSYILPTILGSNLTGNQAYFTGPGGTGTQYAAGATITTSINPMYIYDHTGTTPDCSDEEIFTITVNPVPVFTWSKTDLSCFESCDGTITINASGGTSPYQLDVNNGGWQSWPPENTLTGLCQGTYTIKIMDAKGCVQTECGTAGP